MLLVIFDEIIRTKANMPEVELEHMHADLVMLSCIEMIVLTDCATETSPKKKVQMAHIEL